MDHIDKAMAEIHPRWACCQEDERLFLRAKKIAETMLRSGEAAWNMDAWCEEIYLAMYEEAKMGQIDGKLDLEKSQFFECRCSSNEHVVRFSYVSMPDPEPEVYLSVYLSAGGFFHRLWRAVRYVFGYKCRYGDFDEAILREDDLDRIIALLRAYRDDMAKRKQQYLENSASACARDEFEVVGGTSSPMKTVLQGENGLKVEIEGGKDLGEHVGLVKAVREMKGWQYADVYGRVEPKKA